jgi:hypothetical protein
LFFKNFKSNFQLKKGDPFDFLKSGKEYYFDVTSIITLQVLAVVVNTDRSAPIDVSILLDEYLEDSNPIGGIFVGFGTAVCCFFCFFIVCIAIIVKSRRSGGYHSIGYETSSNVYDTKVDSNYNASGIYNSIGDVTNNLYDKTPEKQVSKENMVGGYGSTSSHGGNQYSGTVGGSEESNYYQKTQNFENI